MINKNTKAYIIIAIVLFIFFILINIELLDSISYAIAITVAVEYAYNLLIWRINPLEKTPRLRRKYISHQVSTYNGGTTMEVEIKIKQTLSRISIFEVWNTGKCKSITASLVEDQDTGEWRLIYTYLTDPPLTLPGQPLDDMHYGTVILNYRNRNLLEGRYFTARYEPTAGTIRFVPPTKK